MPKKTLKRLLPKPAKLREIKYLSVLGNWIYEPNLWHINRYSAAVAFFVGLFCAMLPIPGQMFVAAIAAVLLRCNLPLSITLIWITNPLTMGPIFYLAYRLGALLLGIPAEIDSFNLSWGWVSSSFDAIWLPLLTGSLVMGISLGSLGYFLMMMLWRIWIIRRWRKRRRRRAATPDAK